MRRGDRIAWKVKPQRLGRVVAVLDDGDVVVKWDDMGFAQHMPVDQVVPAKRAKR